MARMNLLKFCVYTLIGATLWNSFLLWLGWKLQEHIADILQYRTPSTSASPPRSSSASPFGTGSTCANPTPNRSVPERRQVEGAIPVRHREGINRIGLGRIKAVEVIHNRFGQVSLLSRMPWTTIFAIHTRRSCHGGWHRDWCRCREGQVGLVGAQGVVEHGTLAVRSTKATLSSWATCDRPMGNRRG